MAEHLSIITKEGVVVQVDARLTSLSGLIKSIVDDMASSEEIPIEALSTESLNLILEYFAHYDYSQPTAVPCPLPSADLREAIPSWDFEFISRFNLDSLCEFYNLVDYLQIPSLSELCAAAIASFFKGKTAAEVRVLFNMPSDLTPEIEEQLMLKYPWARDDYEQLSS
mmetsp:Transcript_5350/g.9821  ORF Transcript_5350/g.9821 Transcript_5350/m.9821 type:complete len:168 (-) Transcript_5350:3166-3669(-)